jgi:transcriptional regulator with XRE-family HTH domain
MMKGEPTTYESFRDASTTQRRLLRQEELILEVTEALADVLQKHAITRTELAHRLGKTKGFVSQLLSGGRNLTLRTIADIADALGYRLAVKLERAEVELPRRSSEKWRALSRNSVATWSDKEVNNVANTLSFGNLSFVRVCQIEPERDGHGRIWESERASPEGTSKDRKLHRYGRGPFCRFSITRGWSRKGGIYIITVDEKPSYLGKCEDLETRFNHGYGHISAGKRRHRGQQTNCRINHEILNAVRREARIELWFFASDNRDELEASLINKNSLDWNRNRPSGESRRSAGSKPTGSRQDREVIPRGKRESGAAPTVKDFREELNRRIAAANRRGESSLVVNAGDLHRAVGGYPGRRHRMRTCCDVISSFRTPGDRVLEQPPSGYGASLTVRYCLPRHPSSPR